MAQLFFQLSPDVGRARTLGDRCMDKVMITNEIVYDEEVSCLCFHF